MIICAQKHVNNTSRSIQNIFHCQKSVNTSPSIIKGAPLFYLLSRWISSFGCILGKYQSISYSSFLYTINLYISKLVDLRGIYKTLIWVYDSVSLSALDFGIRYKTLTGKYLIKIQLSLCHPHKTLLM